MTIDLFPRPGLEPLMPVEKTASGGVTAIRGKGVSRDMILDCAAYLFAQRGYRATNLMHVADGLHVTRQALYHHFSKKGDILAALFSRLLDAFEDAADKTAQTYPDPERRFFALLEGHARTVAENINLVTIFLSENTELTTSGRAEDIRARRASYTQRFIDAYEAGANAGVLRAIDAKVAVYLILGAPNSAIRWYSPDGALGPKELADTVVDLFRSGVVSDES